MDACQFESLPAGQRRVCEKLLDPHCYRYVDVATGLQISAGTVRQHLARVRAKHPAVYAEMMAERRRQLEERHDRAEAREQNRRGWLLCLFERRVDGHQVGVDLESMFAAMSYYNLSDPELKALVETGFEPLPGGGAFEPLPVDPLPEFELPPAEPLAVEPLPECAFEPLAVEPLPE